MKLPAEGLSLSSCKDNSLPSLLTFLSNFAKTLTTLTLRFLKEDATTTDPSITLTPLLRLHSLTLVTSHTRALLACFDPSPIEHLTVGENAQMPTSAWEAFIESHARTLKRVTILAVSQSCFADPCRACGKFASGMGPCGRITVGRMRTLMTGGCRVHSEMATARTVEIATLGERGWWVERE